MKDEIFCELDDRGFEPLLINQIGRNSFHTRWQHVIEESFIFDLWIGRKGITVWKKGAQSQRFKKIDQALDFVDTMKRGTAV